jgi:hypothetical protein
MNSCLQLFLALGVSCRFDRTPLRVGVTVVKVTQKQVSLRARRFSPVVMIAPDRQSFIRLSPTLYNISN